MLGNQLVALAIFGSYFLVIIALFVAIVRTIPWANARTSTQKGRVRMFAGLALASFAHTWYYMIRFLLWSRDEYEARVPGNQTLPAVQRLSNWLLNTELFEQAWFTVCEHPHSWLLSEQLCLFTVGAWTLFLYNESKKRSMTMRPWLFMALGQLVAISVASNLFCLALALTPPAARPQSGPRRIPAFVWLCIAIAMSAVALSPATLHSHFMLNLLAMHGAIILPLLPVSFNTKRLALRPEMCYLLAAVASFVIRLKTLYLAGQFADLGLAAQAKRLHFHPAQASIGWDVIWSTVSFAVYEYMEHGTLPPKTYAYSVIGTLGFAAPLVLLQVPKLG